MKNSPNYVLVVILVLRALIHALLDSSCATVMFFLFTRSKMCGAKVRGASSSSQVWCQNFTFMPFPSVILMEA